MYMSRGRSWTFFGWPGRTAAKPHPRVIRAGQRKSERRSSVPFIVSWVRMGMTMLTARVIRKMPRMKAIMRRVGRAMVVRAQAERAAFCAPWQVL
ncbi:hypothetical protein D3C78_1562090 [compost metagenome]